MEGFIIDKIKNCILTDGNLAELIQVTNEEIEALNSDGSDKLEGA